MILPNKYKKAKEYMLANQMDAVHDAEHIYRVLRYALDIARHENSVNMDVLYTACLLHDIGRVKEFETDGSHAKIGGDMAFNWLPANGHDAEFAARVRDCIYFHSYRANLNGRNDRAPSIEAKILYDADKLDSAGAVGIARAIAYGGLYNEPLYLKDEKGRITDEKGPSFLHEYHTKLARVYDGLHTARAREIGAAKRAAAEGFYSALCVELGIGEQSRRRV